MVTHKVLFNCVVAVDYKKRILIIDRKLNTFEVKDDYHHMDAFEECEVSQQYSCSDDDYELGLYEVDVWLVYETIEYQGGQGGTEYDSYLEFEQFILISVIEAA